MANLRAASRYAKSLLELAAEKGVLEEVFADMKLFTEVCNENYNFVLMLKNPIIKHDKNVRSCMACLKDVYTSLPWRYLIRSRIKIASL